MKNNMKIKFNITSYNFKSDSSDPTEMNLTIKKEINDNDNFLDIVESIASKYRIDEHYSYQLDDIYRILWSEHFTGEFLDDILKNFDENDYSKLNVPVKELDKQFNLQSKTIKIIIHSSEYNKDMKFFFHINRDNESVIPHVHCRCCGIERRIDLTRIEFIKRPFESRNLSMQALSIVNRYQSELMKYWEKVLESNYFLEFNFTI